MKVFILPVLSLVFSILYYTPWLFGATRANLGPYVLAFFWFLGAWVLFFVYSIKAMTTRKKDGSIVVKYALGAAIILVSYIIVWVGIFNGYMVTV